LNSGRVFSLPGKLDVLNYSNLEKAYTLLYLIYFLACLLSSPAVKLIRRTKHKENLTSLNIEIFHAILILRPTLRDKSEGLLALLPSRTSASKHLPIEINA